MEKRVDIKLEEETLKWAAIEAAKVGISRRELISRGFTVFMMLIESKVIDLDPFGIYIQQQPKCSLNT